MPKVSPKVSIVIPIHWFDGWQFFLMRCLESIERQTFTDYEVIITKAGSMAVNSNRAIQCARGEIVKVLYVDDYLTQKDSLQKMVDAFTGGWLVTGCLHDDDGRIGNLHVPKYNDQIHTGNNTIGSPSVLMFENKNPLLFDENMSWTLDCDLYKRLFNRYGAPITLNDPLVTLGIGGHQTTYKLTDEEKAREVDYSIKKHT